MNVELPILNSGSPAGKQRPNWRSLFVHACRVALFIGIVFLIRKQHRELVENRTDASALSAINVAELQELIPNASGLTPWNRSSSIRIITSPQNEEIGTLLQTAPIGNASIGYLGPTNLMVILSEDKRILDIKILDSEDTFEHVNAVAESDEFLASYRGLKWDFPDLWPDIDSVSGATLTSFAVKQSLQARAGSQINFSKFPNKIESHELAQFFPEFQPLSIHNNSENPNLVFGSVHNNINAKVGYFLRTSPIANSLSGYQGPTDTLIAFDERFRFLGSLIRSSYDNEPYVEYVKEDTYLDDLIRGKNLQEISGFDPTEYEGVSGATMTSLNVLAGIQTTVKHLQEYETRIGKGPNWIWVFTECLTVLLGLIGICFSFTGVSRRRLRLVFQVILIIYLGFIAGEILSQAVVFGWAQNGLPLKNAPGMVLLCVSALAVPIISKHNSYCDHICPFGAVQQLAMKSGMKRVRVNRRLRRVLKLVPATLLIISLLAASGHLSLNLASIEPFDAFSFRVAGWITIAIAVTGLFVSFFQPMAYCRYGCPTGAMLNFLRFNRRSHEFQLRDGVALLMLILALVITI